MEFLPGEVRSSIIVGNWQSGLGGKRVRVGGDEIMFSAVTEPLVRHCQMS